MAEQRVGLKAEISADMTKFAATMRNVGALTQKTASKISTRMAGVSKAMAQTAISAGKVSAALAGAGTAVALTKALKGAANLETLTVAFRTLVGDVETADKALKQIRDLGASTPFEFTDLAGAGRQLIAFGVSAENVTERLRMIGDVSAGVGANVGEIAEIFGKARVAGTLYAEDINQLVGRGIPVIQEFAKQMGVSEGEVKKLASQGNVTFPMLKKAFEDLTAEGGKFFGMMEAKSQTSAGKMSTLRDTISNSLVELGKPINSALLPFLDDAIKLADSLAPKLKALGEGVANVLTFARADFQGAMSQVLELMKAAFNVAGAYLGNAVLNSLAKALNLFSDLWGDKITEIVDGMEAGLKRGIKNATQMMVNPIAMVKHTKDAITAGNDATKNAGKSIGESIAETLAKNDPFNLDDATAKLESVWNSILNSPSTNKGKASTQAPTPSPSGGGGSNVSNTYKNSPEGQALAQTFGHVARDVSDAVQGIKRSSPISPAAQAAAMKMSSAATSMVGHHQAGFSGLAGLQKMQLQRMQKVGPGTTGIFAKDRARLGIGSGLTTGGLGAKRAVGKKASEEQLKKQAELAKSSDEHLMDIKTDLKKALTVS